jgi:hypothetical protein
MVVRYEVDTSDVEAELERLERLDSATLLRLEAVLAMSYAATQQAVHVITGSLKGSGRFSSSAHGNSWHGEIRYGGVSPGINNPVDYAEYEQRRGGAHDFIAPAVAMEGRYGLAVVAHLRGDR